jgi:hypothetical protein
VRTGRERRATINHCAGPPHNKTLGRMRRMAALSEEAEMAKRAHWPLWLGVGYAVLVGAALVFALQPGGEGLRGVWSVLLALPWSLLSVFVFDAINPRFIDQFGPVAALVGGLLNAYLLYFIASRSQRQDK